MSKTNLSDVYDLLEAYISLDKIMKKVNKHYQEIGYPIFNGFQTDYTNIHKFDTISAETINNIKTNKKYKNFRESIENPEVEILIDRLFEDAKTGTMPFNDSSLACTAKHLIYYCLSVECVDNIAEETVDRAKKLYSVYEQEPQMYQPYILPIIQNIMSSDKPKVHQNSKKKKS